MKAILKWFIFNGTALWVVYWAYTGDEVAMTVYVWAACIMGVMGIMLLFLVIGARWASQDLVMRHHHGVAEMFEKYPTPLWRYVDGMYDMLIVVMMINLAPVATTMFFIATIGLQARWSMYLRMKKEMEAQE